MKKLRLYFLLLLAFICGVLLFVGGPDKSTLRSLRYGWDLGHLVCFGLWSYLYLLWRGRRSFQRLSLEVLLLCLLFGAVTELLQAQIGREATIQDLGNDLVGGLLGLAFLPSGLTGSVRRWLWSYRLLVLLVVGWIIFPIAKMALDDVIARQQFPLLSGFETPLEVSRWGGSAFKTVSTEVAFSGKASLQVRFGTQRYSGVAFREFPRDWSGFARLGLEIFSPYRDSFKIYLRIHDQLHDNQYTDRYNRTVTLMPGWNEVDVSLQDVRRAPRTRQLDLSRVAEMVLFVGKLSAPRTVYIDNVALIPAGK